MKTSCCLVVLSAILLSACQDASTASRDDGVLAAQLRHSSTSPLYESAVKAEAQRLMEANPKLDRREAYKQAYKNVPASSTAPSAEELRRQKRAKSQKEFEKDLAKVLGK